MNRTIFGRTPRLDNAPRPWATRSRVVRSAVGAAAIAQGSGQAAHTIDFDEVDSTSTQSDAGWTVGYLDVLLLLVTLFATLFGLTYLQPGPSNWASGSTGTPFPNTLTNASGNPTPLTPFGPSEPGSALTSNRQLPLGETVLNHDANFLTAITGSSLLSNVLNGGYLFPGTGFLDSSQNVANEFDAERQRVYHTALATLGSPMRSASDNRDHDHTTDLANYSSELKQTASYMNQTASYIRAPELSPALRNQAEPIYEAFIELIAWTQNNPRNPDLEVVLDPRQLRLEVGDAILFPSGSADLGPDGRQWLAELVAELPNMAVAIDVEGHTDDVPIQTARFPSNWELSSLRAVNVARELVALGIPETKLRVSGYADTRPRMPNDSAANRAQNRRVSLLLRPTEQTAEMIPPPVSSSRAQTASATHSLSGG